MTSVNIRTTSPIDPNIVAHYQRRMHGQLETPETTAASATDSGDQQRLKGEPALVTHCLTAHDVAIAVALARELQLEIVVHSGGYNQTGQHLNSACLLVDLSQLRQMMLDPLQQIARVEPGVTNDELAQAAATHGLVGATDDILAFEVVTIAGAIVTASAHEHSDLFLALQESNTTIGVVTAIMYRLHKLEQ